MNKLPKKISREEAAIQEMNRTQVGRWYALTFFLIFMICLCAVPVWQMIREVRSGSDQPLVLPACFDVFHIVSESWNRYERQTNSPLRKITDMNVFVQKRLRDYEQHMEETSFLTEYVLPHVQWALTAWGGVGNEKVLTGRDQWLFYGPDVHFLTDKGFLDPEVQRRRRRSAKAWETPPLPDPIPAILDFKNQLAARGIELILLPIPVKTAWESRHYDGINRTNDALPENPSTRDFFRRLDAANVEYVDVSRLFSDQRKTNQTSLYLRSDTHWRPECMQQVAFHLSSLLKKKGYLAKQHTEAFKSQIAFESSAGDIAAMLVLPPQSQVRPSKERVPVRRINDADESPWQADPQAEVLLLGDSFSNIYSLPSLGWGHHAGLAEQLSFELQHPVDRMVRNDDSAYATRQLLANEWQRNPSRLTHKKVVIWQFSMRELMYGDWKQITL